MGCENDVNKLLEIVTTEFPSFRDQAVYEGVPGEALSWQSTEYESMDLMQAQITNNRYFPPPPPTSVAFYNRAQILVADLWACFEGETFGKFDNIEDITCFADYRVPQVSGGGFLFISKINADALASEVRYMAMIFRLTRPRLEK